MRRTRLDIIIDILLLVVNKGANKTKIVYGANLNFKIAHKYIEFMLETGLIEERKKDGKTLYYATEKGICILEKYRELMEEASF